MKKRILREKDVWQEQVNLTETHEFRTYNAGGWASIICGLWARDGRAKEENKKINVRLF